VSDDGSAAIMLDEGQAGGYDEIGGSCPAFVNLLAVGPPEQRPRVVRTRPGIVAWADFPAVPPVAAPVVAMGVLQGKLVYFTDDGLGDRRACALFAPGDARELFVRDFPIGGALPLTIAVGRNVIIATGGGHPQKVDSGLQSSRLLNAPSASDVSLIAQRVVLTQPGTGLVFWSDPGEGNVESWDILREFMEAESRPDNNVGLKETARELWVFGETTMQVFTPDETATFSTTSTIDVGCASKRSIIRRDNQMAWVDDRKRIVASEGGAVGVLSDRGLAATIKGVTTTADSWGFRCAIGNHDLLTWVFPTDGRAFSWDTISQTWSEWRRWANGRWQAWAPTSYLWRPDTSQHLVGMPDGTIAELSMDAHSDLDDALKWIVRTGFYESPKRRHCIDARFPMRRGGASATSSVSITWRDNLGAFVPPIQRTLGAPGDYDIEAEISPAGSPYKRRQWELSGSAADAYSLAAGRELYEEAEF
jgi:hypothetical protein